MVNGKVILLSSIAGLLLAIGIGIWAWFSWKKLTNCKCEEKFTSLRPARYIRPYRLNSYFDERPEVDTIRPYGGDGLQDAYKGWQPTQDPRGNKTIIKPPEKQPSFPKYHRRRYLKNLWANSPPVSMPPIDESTCYRFAEHTDGELVLNSFDKSLMRELDWTFTCWMKINRDTIGDVFAFLRKEKETGPPESPVMMYDPDSNAITLFMKNEFVPDFYLTVPLNNIDLDEWNYFTWVQRRNETEIYLNGILVATDNMENAKPRVYLGPLIINSGEKNIEFSDIRVCNIAYNNQTINYIMNN